MNLKCLFKGHDYFKETIYLPFDEKYNRVWNTLIICVCVRCGSVKASVMGKDDKGHFVAGSNGQQLRDEKVYRWR